MLFEITEINDRGNLLRWPCDTLYPHKLALTLPTSGGRSVGIVRSRTKATVFSFIWNEPFESESWHSEIWWKGGMGQERLRTTALHFQFLSANFWRDLRFMRRRLLRSFGMWRHAWFGRDKQRFVRTYCLHLQETFSVTRTAFEVHAKGDFHAVTSHRMRTCGLILPRFVRPACFTLPTRKRQKLDIHEMNI
jgi:hypothetical protein